MAETCKTERGCKPLMVREFVEKTRSVMPRLRDRRDTALAVKDKLRVTDWPRGRVKRSYSM